MYRLASAAARPPNLCQVLHLASTHIAHPQFLVAVIESLAQLLAVESTVLKLGLPVVADNTSWKCHAPFCCDVYC